MLEAVIRALISICVVVLCVYLVLWVLAGLGLSLPAMVVKIFWIIAVLIIILILFRLLRPFAGTWLP